MYYSESQKIKCISTDRIKIQTIKVRRQCFWSKTWEKLRGKLKFSLCVVTLCLTYLSCNLMIKLCLSIFICQNTQINHPKRIAEYYNKLYWLTIKLHNTTASIGFIKKALYALVTPKFAQIKKQFVNDEEKHRF